MKEMFFAVVVTVFGAVNIWLVNVQAKKIDEVFGNMRNIDRQLCYLENQIKFEVTTDELRTFYKQRYQKMSPDQTKARFLEIRLNNLVAAHNGK